MRSAQGRGGPPVREWAALRLEGWERCVMSTSSPTHREPREYTGGHRVASRIRGQQCCRWVRPEEMKANGGVPVCKQHLAKYAALVRAATAVALERRRRLDPGCPVE